jgi:protein-L-isoaspartate(D-aspartate) O-methyltransferase
MNREPEPKIIRRTFAKRITAAGGVSNPRVEAAFAVVAREDFHRARAVADRALGRRLSHDAGFRPGLPTPTDVIGILPERNLNNGPPSIHAALIAAATAPQLGEQVVHLGAGVGYYTAILAELIGATGGG